MSTIDKEALQVSVDESGKQGQVSYVIERQNTLFPMPSPENMQGYENIVPGFTERVLKMAENQQEMAKSKQDHILESNTVRNQSVYQLAFREQIFAFTIGIAGIAVAAYGFSVDIGLPAALVAIASVSYFVWRVVKNKNRQ